MKEPDKTRTERCILFATDGTARSERVLPAVAELAQRLLADVNLIHDVDPTLAEDWDPQAAARNPGVEIERAERHMRERLERSAMKLREKGVPANVVLTRRGVVADAICDHAREHGVDLVVLVAEKSQSLADLLTGSVVSDVLEKAPCPVLTLTPEQGSEGVAWKRVLMPIAFDELSRKTAREALNWIPESARIDLLYVVEGSFPLFHGARGEKVDHFDEKEFEERFASDVDAFWKKVGGERHQEHEVHAHRRQGNDEQEILEAARSLEADVIVIGAEGGDGLSRQLGVRLANHPDPCPVLSVPAVAVGA